MLTTHIKASGPLFNKKTNLKKIIQEAVQETADWGQNRIRNRSPVKSGKLKAGWYLSPGKSFIRVDNPVIYTPFVEKRVGMISKTIPEIKKKLAENLSKATDKLK